jgi:hypothetical protein
MAKRRRGPTLTQRSRSVSPQQKAIYHAVTGAGKARTIRDFFDLGPDDPEAIRRLLQSRVTERMTRGV